MKCAEKRGFNIQYIFLASCLISNIYGSDTIKHYVSPLDIPLFLSGNFGELRSNHFHAGIDIKTQGETGKKVYSVADGYISRIKVQTNGYGKAVYITHYDGNTTVYAHLDGFRDDIEEYVINEQYTQKSYEVDLFLNNKTFMVKQGEFMAFSGNTGGSGGPHLHFEIRDKNEFPLNALSYSFDIKDNIPPVIYAIYMYPVNNGQINGRNEKIRINTFKKNGEYVLDTDKVPVVYGKFGLGMEANDYTNESLNRCGIYDIQLIADSNLIFQFVMDRLSFNEVRYINAHVDYEEKTINNKNVHKLYVMPNDKLSNYKYIHNNGIIEIADTMQHNIIINVKDTYGNISVLKFNIIGKHKISVLNEKISDVNPMKFGLPNSFELNDIKVIIPAFSLYDDIDFNFIKARSPVDSNIDLYHIHKETAPLHKNITIAIKPKDVQDKFKNKLCIARLNNENKSEYYGGKLENGYVTTTSRDFGRYFISIDTINPVITTVNFTNNSNISDKVSLKLLITDDFSGIRNYTASIDGEWALFEYDKKNNLLEYYFKYNRIEKNKWHDLVMLVYDDLNNFTEFKTRFFW